MPDARLPDPWLGHPDFSSISDGAWRLFTHALMWSCRYATDGVVDKRFYADLHVRGDYEAYILELMDNRIIFPSSSGFMIPWEARGQSLALEIEKRRQQNRERKARQKERESMRDGMREGMRDGMRGVGQDRQGQDDTF